MKQKKNLPKSSNLKVIFVAAILVGLVSGFLLSQFMTQYGTPTGKAFTATLSRQKTSVPLISSNTFSCYDADNGDYPNTFGYGTLSDQNGRMLKVLIDQCLSDTVIGEVVCSGSAGSTLTYSEHSCPAGKLCGKTSRSNDVICLDELPNLQMLHTQDYVGHPLYDTISVKTGSEGTFIYKLINAALVAAGPSKIKITVIGPDGFVISEKMFSQGFIPLMKTINLDPISIRFTSPGIWKIVASADVDNTVSESNEQDNTHTTEIVVS